MSDKLTTEEKLELSRGDADRMRVAVRHANKGLSRLSAKVQRLKTLLDEKEHELATVEPYAVGAISMKGTLREAFSLLAEIAASPSSVNEATGSVEVAITPLLHARVRGVVYHAGKKEVRDVV
jgi:hypothetical protein